MMLTYWEGVDLFHQIASVFLPPSPIHWSPEKRSFYFVEDPLKSGYWILQLLFMTFVGGGSCLLLLLRHFYLPSWGKLTFLHQFVFAAVILVGVYTVLASGILIFHGKDVVTVFNRILRFEKMMLKCKQLQDKV